MLIPLFKDIVVIGAGVGGLISSTILQRSGLNVTLLEKNNVCGGRMNSFQIISNDARNYRFDVGPSLLLLKDIYEKTFTLIGKNISDYIELLPVDPLYRCYFEDYSSFSDITRDNTRMEITLNQIEPHGYNNFIQYMNTAKSFLVFGLPVVIEENLTVNIQHMFKFLLACIKDFPLLSHYKMLSKYFKSNKLRAMMSFQDLYIGLSPYEAPAIFSLLQALELDQGDSICTVFDRYR